MTARRVPFDETYLDASYAWLQDPEMARLTMSAAMTREQQKAWYDTLAGRTDYAIWGIEYDGAPVGVMGLKHLDSDDGGAEYFMYLGDTSVWGKGIARWATDEILAEARSRGLTYVYGLVGKHNERSLSVHTHLGFEIDGERDGKWLLVQRC
ncbi:MAG TPA: GNAT family N-acetyltransferase [Frankiaceae bacterium]|nr:GNAT family N-acetyltransferase [Frankiaceae bacterium]